jgi:excisionase family DNA binding protein
MSFFKGNYYTPKEASEKLGVHWQTLKNWEKNGKIKCVRSPGGKRYYDIQDFIQKTEKNLKNDKKEEKNKKELLNIRKKICYCRVSSYSQKIELKNQIEYMKDKYPNHEILSDIGSGINFNRNNLNKIINYGIKNELEELVIAYKDRLCRIGYELIENILKEYSNTKIIIEKDENKSPEEELTNDLIEIITVFSSKLNGMRSYKTKKDEI